MVLLFLIQNCNITLNSTNFWTASPLNLESGATGILLHNRIRTSINSPLTITSGTGRNDNNQFLGNTILNVINGFVISGYNDGISPYNYYDQNNIIGAAGLGNTIEKYGNIGSNIRSSGIYTIYQNNIDISYNVFINYGSGGGAHTGKLYGIFISSPISGSYGQIISVTNNTISLLKNSSEIMVGIKIGNSGVDATSISILSNIIEDCSFISGTDEFYGIDQSFSASNLIISNNLIQNNNLNTNSTSASYLIYNTNRSSTVTVSNNNLINNSLTGSPIGTLYGYYNNSTTAVGISTIQDNLIDGLSVPTTSASSVIGIRLSSAIAQLKKVNGNTITNLVGGTSTSAWTAGIYINYMAVGSEITMNTVSNVSSPTNVVGINCASLTSSTTSFNQSFVISNNNVEEINSTSNSAKISGIGIYTLTAVECK